MSNKTNTNKGRPAASNPDGDNPAGYDPATSGKMSYADDMTEAVGNTPLVRLRRLTRERGIQGTILVKPEFLNPTGSVKDRMAIFLLRQAERKGELREGGTIVEATSGNTGAAVAMFAAAHGYRAILTIPDKMSDEKVNALKAFGAEVHICPTAVDPESPDSYYETAKRLARETKDSYFVGQYFNTDNIESHYRTTGPEIWRQTGGELDIFVGGIGTGGTVSGTARFLKEQKPEIKVIAADPEGSVFYDYFKTGKMPEAHPYLVEGIGDDFLCPTLDFNVIDDIYQVTDKECFVMARELTRKEGIMGGGSSGGIVSVALRYAEDTKMTKDQTMVVILPDHGAKYISKVFNDEWMRSKGFLE